jgi:hypothetical protein
LTLPSTNQHDGVTFCPGTRDGRAAGLAHYETRKLNKPPKAPVPERPTAIKRVVLPPKGDVSAACDRVWALGDVAKQDHAGQLTAGDFQHIPHSALLLPGHERGDPIDGRLFGEERKA